MESYVEMMSKPVPKGYDTTYDPNKRKHTKSPRKPEHELKKVNKKNLSESSSSDNEKGGKKDGDYLKRVLKSQANKYSSPNK